MITVLFCPTQGTSFSHVEMVPGERKKKKKLRCPESDMHVEPESKGSGESWPNACVAGRGQASPGHTTLCRASVGLEGTAGWRSITGVTASPPLPKIGKWSTVKRLDAYFPPLEGGASVLGPARWRPPPPQGVGTAARLPFPAA